MIRDAEAGADGTLIRNWADSTVEELDCTAARSPVSVPSVSPPAVPGAVIDPNVGVAPLTASSWPPSTALAHWLAPEVSSHGQKSIGPAADVALVITDCSRFEPCCSRRSRPDAVNGTQMSVPVGSHSFGQSGTS